MQYLSPGGAIIRPAARRRARRGCRSTRARKALAASRERELLQRRDVSGVHLRVLTVGRGPRRGGADRPSADRGRSRSAAAALDPARRRRRRHPGGRAARRRRGARGAGARLSLHAPHRGADGQSRTSRSGSRSRARTSSPALRAASTPRSTRSSARPRRSATSWRTRATSCARRSRACAPTSRCSQDADRLPEDDRAGLRADIIAELDELTALVGDVVELARGAKPSDVVDDVRIDQIVRAARRARRARGGRRGRLPDALEPTVVSGEPERISRAISNLIGNAHKWSPPGGLIEIDLERRRLCASAITARASTRPTCRTSSTASTAPTARAACRGRASAWRSCARPRRRTAAPCDAANALGGGAIVTVSFGPSVIVGDDAAADASAS